jgi:hypothetical protein
VPANPWPWITPRARPGRGRRARVAGLVRYGRVRHRRAAHGPRCRTDRSGGGGESAGPEGSAGSGGFDPDKPSAARVYDYLLGGKDNFAADRDAAAKLLEALPDAADVAKANRAFLAAAVSPNGAFVPYTAVVQAARVIRPYVQGFEMNNIRPSDWRMIHFLAGLSQP